MDGTLFFLFLMLPPSLSLFRLLCAQVAVGILVIATPLTIPWYGISIPAHNLKHTLACAPQKPADFSLGWLMKNPMAIMMVVMVLFVFILPKMVDPESMKEMQKEMQQMKQMQRQGSSAPSLATASDETQRQIGSSGDGSGGARRRN